MYVITKRLKAKYKVKYLSILPTLDAYYQRFNRIILVEAVTRDLRMKYVNEDDDDV